MRKTAKWAAIILLVGALFAGIGALMGGVNSVTYDHGFQVVHNETVTRKLGNVKQLEADSDNAYVEIVAGNQAAVTVSGPDAKATKINLDNGILTIAHSGNNNGIGFDFGSAEAHIKITLPQKTLKQLNLNLTSGNLKLQQVTTKDANISLDSGRIVADQLTISHNGLLKNNSGDVELSHSSLTKVTTQISSGELSINNSTLNSFTATNSSGDTEIEHSKLTGVLSLTNRSGDVELNNSNTSGYRLQTDSGNISLHDTEHASPYNQDPDAADRLEVTNNSGDIDIE
ncbi:DUF4097 family beta strand repeat-containing protein [Loigolactobacillus zhaoyuanensis]|uniref:DUF4097 family beta strand repeat-containing protein n=1 Tax=Loigolactobacillus zhaoyuanensis TaxID=2486017 RepID=A0ABW8UGA1_9LACO